MSLKVVDLPIEKPKQWTRVSSNLVLHVASGIYYVRKKKAGKGELFQTTGQTNKKAAEGRALELISEWVAGTKKVGAERFISDVCDEIEEVLKKEFENGDRSKATADHDKAYLPIIRKYFGIHRASEIDETFWDEWVRTVGRSSGRTLGDIAKYLSKVLTFSYQRKYINRKPQIKNPDKPKKNGAIYENADIENFIAHACPLLQDLIVVAAECGLRPHETAGLRWDWLTFEKDCVIISIPDEFEKRRQGRSLKTSPNVTECLRRRLKSRVGPYVFPAPKSTQKPISRFYLGKLWRKMLADAKITQGIKFHWFRHSFFSKALLEAKLPLAEVAQYGGNSPSILMKRYLQNDPNRTQNVSTAVRLNLSVKKV